MHMPTRAEAHDTPGADAGPRVVTAMDSLCGIELFLRAVGDCSPKFPFPFFHPNLLVQ
jgi:hypothetical protein